MTEHLKDVIVSIPTGKAAQMSSWLLGHGFLADHSSVSEDGATTFYAVEDMSLDGRTQLEGIGATVVSAWKTGEEQSST